MTNHSTASKWNILTALVFGILLVGSSTASAAPIIFDFEEIILGSANGVPSPIFTSSKSGLTLTVTRHDGANIGIQNTNFFIPSLTDFGHVDLVNLAGPSNATSADAALVLNFSAPIASGSISFGDVGAPLGVDDDGLVVLTGFSGLNGTGAILGSVSVLYPDSIGFGTQGNSAIRTLSLSALGIQSLTISSGGPFPGTLYFDNVIVDQVAPVPEPASILLLGTGLAGVLARRRTRRS